MAAGQYLTSAWRTLSTAFTLDATGEKFAFARFRGGGEAEAAAGGRAFEHHGATELTEMQSNGAAARRDDGKDPAAAAVGEFCPTEDRDHGDGGELKKDRNRISAWQAGWNVTNAIQVKPPNRFSINNRSVHSNLGTGRAIRRKLPIGYNRAPNIPP